MRATITSIWVNVGGGITGQSALSIKPSSPLYDERRHRPNQPITAYTLFNEETVGEFLLFASESTGLNIVEFDTFYTLQFRLEPGDEPFDRGNSLEKLTEFVAEHFSEYDQTKD